MFDYRANRAVAAEAAFLTVVGSPTNGMHGNDANRSAAAANEERGASNRKRHNVYIVWLTPRTKICEATRQRLGRRPLRSETQRSEQKREVALENLEVGDHVEIQFTENDDPARPALLTRTEQMRRKHGRHRTHVGFATEVTICPPARWARHDAADGTKGEARLRVIDWLPARARLRRRAGRRFCFPASRPLPIAHAARAGCFPHRFPAAYQPTSSPRATRSTASATIWAFHPS